jgi:2-C-methyl-D-erythritol 4-phosphate cytidylyltransferase
MKSAIILAGGKGVRFNGEKQFIHFHGKPLYKHVYDKVADLVDEVIIVGIDVKPGETRTKSVLNGLNAVSPNSKRVIILEAARPLVNREQIKTLLNCSSNSCSFATPLIETIIIDGCSYPDRVSCLSFQTPQAFNTQMLIEAYSKNLTADMTDETRVIFEHYNEKPVLYPGGPNLTKVTHPHDIELLNILIKIYNINIYE